MTNPKNQYPNKKDAKFTIDSIGQIFQTDSPAVYFEKHYRENFNPDNYTNYVGDGAIYYGGAGCRLDFHRLPGPVFDPPRRETAGRVTR